MNIIDVTPEEVEKEVQALQPKDTMDLLLKIGKEYMQKYQSEPIDIDTKEGQKEFRRISCYLIEELMEMQNCLKIREWSISEYPVDQQHFAEEFADFFNFVMQIPLLLGYEEEKIKDIIIRKRIVNKFRQESSY